MSYSYELGRDLNLDIQKLETGRIDTEILSATLQSLDTQIKYYTEALKSLERELKHYKTFSSSYVNEEEIRIHTIEEFTQTKNRLLGLKKNILGNLIPTGISYLEQLSFTYRESWREFNNDCGSPVVKAYDNQEMFECVLSEAIGYLYYYEYNFGDYTCLQQTSNILDNDDFLSGKLPIHRLNTVNIGYFDLKDFPDEYYCRQVLKIVDDKNFNPQKLYDEGEA